MERALQVGFPGQEPLRGSSRQFLRAHSCHQHLWARDREKSGSPEAQGCSQPLLGALRLDVPLELS